MANQSSWIPVMPELDKKGAFRSLASLENGEELKPLPLKDAKDSYAIYNEDTNFTKKASSKLTIAALGGIESKFNAKTIIHDLAFYRKVTANANTTGLIRGTWWGIGVRLKLIITDIAFGMDIKIGNVGASSELGLCNVEYEISGIGLNDKELFSYLPEPGNITIKSMKDIRKSFDKIKNYISKVDKSKYNLQPFRILIEDKESIDPLSPHQHMIYTYQCIKARKKLKDALSESLKLGLNPSIIAHLYKEEFELTNRNSKPSRADRKDAEKWLGV